MIDLSKYLFNTRGCINSNNNCFLNCLIIAMFGYRLSPFYKVSNFKDGDPLYVYLISIVDSISKDKYPDITEIRKILPKDMQFGQQDSTETFDSFMKLLHFEPMTLKMAMEKKGKKITINSFEQNVSYVFLNNNGKDGITPIEDLFYPPSWDDLGTDKNNWIKNKHDQPTYRYTRTRIKEFKGDCLIFIINRSKDQYNRHSNNVKTPFTIENNGRFFFRFATLLHIGSTINFGHYITILCDRKNHYIYDDSSGKKILNNRINYEKNSDFIEKNSIMYFYYPYDSSSP